MVYYFWDFHSVIMSLITFLIQECIDHSIFSPPGSDILSCWVFHFPLEFVWWLSIFGVPSYRCPPLNSIFIFHPIFIYHHNSHQYIISISLFFSFQWYSSPPLPILQSRTIFGLPAIASHFLCLFESTAWIVAFWLVTDWPFREECFVILAFKELRKNS